MTKFEEIQEIDEVKEFSSVMYELASMAGSAAKLETLLKEKAEDQPLEMQGAGQAEFAPMGKPGFAVNARYKILEREAREKNCSVYDLLAPSNLQGSFHGTFRTNAEPGIGIKAAALQFQRPRK